MHGLFDIKTLYSFQNQNKRKTTHSFVLRSLIFELQQEVNDI